MTVDHFNGDTTHSTLTTAGSGPFETSVEFGADAPPSRSVIRAIEAATGIDALNLPPLHAAVDTEALDSVIRSTSSSARLSFDYASLRVTVHSSGDISVTDRDDR